MFKINGGNKHWQILRAWEEKQILHTTHWVASSERLNWGIFPSSLQIWWEKQVRKVRNCIVSIKAQQDRLLRCIFPLTISANKQAKLLPHTLNINFGAIAYMNQKVAVTSEKHLFTAKVMTLTQGKIHEYSQLPFVIKNHKMWNVEQGFGKLLQPTKFPLCYLPKC